jgi:hypothetical protein
VVRKVDRKAHFLLSKIDVEWVVKIVGRYYIPRRLKIARLLSRQ